MGHDVTFLANHKLNTTSINNLAADLAERLQVNIIYGHYGHHPYEKYLGKEKRGFHKQGEFIVNKKSKIYQLSNERHFDQVMYNKYGQTIFDFAKQDLYYENKREFTFPEYRLDTDDESFTTMIYKNCFDNGFVDWPSRWWKFFEYFINEIQCYDRNFEINLNQHSVDIINEFRTKVKHYNTIFGGNLSYYIDDQSKFLWSTEPGHESLMEWHELRLHIYAETGHLMLDVPKILTDKNYRHEFIAKGEYPLSYIDDFRDLD